MARDEIKVLNAAGQLQKTSHATIARKVNTMFGLELPDGSHEKLMSITTVRAAKRATHPPLPAGPVPRKRPNSDLEIQESATAAPIADEDVVDDDTMKNKCARLEAAVDELEARLEKLQAEFDELQAKLPIFEVEPMQDHDVAASEDQEHEADFSR